MQIALPQFVGSLSSGGRKQVVYVETFMIYKALESGVTKIRT